MSGSLMLPDRSTASIRSRPLCGGATASPELLRPRGGGAKQEPRQPGQRRRMHEPGPATGAGDGIEALAVRHPQRGGTAASRRQQPARQPRQRQRQPHPRPGESAERRLQPFEPVAAHLRLGHEFEEALAREIANRFPCARIHLSPVAAFQQQTSRAVTEIVALLLHRGSAARPRPASGRPACRHDARARRSSSDIAAIRAARR